MSQIHFRQSGLEIICQEMCFPNFFFWFFAQDNVYFFSTYSVSNFSKTPRVNGGKQTEITAPKCPCSPEHPIPGQSHQLQVTKSQIPIPPEYPKSSNPSAQVPMKSPFEFQKSSKCPHCKSPSHIPPECKCRLKSPFQSPPSPQVPKFQ